VNAPLLPQALGVYLPDTPPNWDALAEFERSIGVAVDVVSFYWSWGIEDPTPAFEYIEALDRRGRVPLVTWEPWSVPPDPDPARSAWFSLARLLAGDFDRYIDLWAGRLAATSAEVWLRPMHEMNGDWYPWCGTTNGGSPEEWVEAWRYLHARFAGVDSVRWVWCPYVVSVPDTPENAIARYYPGDGFVDRLALDGYNWGTTRPWSRWQSFDELFGRAYDVVTTLAPSPVLLTEVGSAEEGGDKAYWIADALRALATRYPRVRGLVWFNVNKESDWRIESSPGSLDSFRRARGGA